MSAAGYIGCLARPYPAARPFKGVGQVPVAPSVSALRDPHWRNVTLLIQPTATDGDYGTDETDKPLTFYGNTALSSARNGAGGKSLLFDGTGDYLTAADSPSWDVGSAITAEAIVTVGALGAFNPVVGQWGATNAEQAWLLETVGADWRAYIANTGGIAFANSVGTAVVGSTVHVAMTCNGSAVEVFVNGVKGTTGSRPTVNAASLPLYIGTVGGLSGFWNGSIHALRVTTGVIRYTDNFTPPTVFSFGG